MSMLSRYQKSGGFLQLLILIETCGAAKQEKFLQMIEQEDPRWSVAIKRRMLSIKRIMEWDPKILAEFVVRLQDLTVGTALHGLEQADRDKLLSTLSHSQKRKIDEHFSTKKPTAAELSATFIKVIVEARNMMTQGYFRVDQIDPTLVIEEDIEEKLAATFQPEGDANTTFAEKTDTAAPDMSALSAVSKSDGSSADLMALKRQIVQLTKENTTLRTELKKLEEKLNQIRKIS